MLAILAKTAKINTAMVAGQSSSGRTEKATQIRIYSGKNERRNQLSIEFINFVISVDQGQFPHSNLKNLNSLSVSFQM